MLVLTASIGAVLFGYDTGFIGAAVTLPTFQKAFGFNEDNESQLSGNVVATLQAGCFFGVIMMAFITDKIGRRWSLIACGVVFELGAVLQTASHGIIGVFYAGRVLSGLGVGAASMLTPTYISEMAPKRIRGRLLTCYGVMLFASIALSYWVDYACHQTLTGDNQWLVPVGLQLVPGAGLALGMLPLPESSRWLVKKDQRELALRNLKYIRQADTEEVEILEEFAEICDSVEKELAQTSGVTIKEVFLPGYRNRMFLAIMLMIWQQLSGTIAFTYYSTLFFKAVGMNGESASLFATGVYGIVKTVFSLIWMLFFIDRVGRKWSLIGGGAVMAISLFAVAIIYKYTDPKEGAETVAPGTYAMIVMIFVFCVGYSASWGPVPWTYAAEIFPNRIREYGVTAASAIQWAFNFMISKIVPIGVKTLGWKLFLMFGIFTCAAIVYTIIFVKETKGLGLEEMDALFGAPAAIDVNEAHQRVQGIARAEDKEAIIREEEVSQKA